MSGAGDVDTEGSALLLLPRPSSARQRASHRRPAPVRFPRPLRVRLVIGERRSSIALCRTSDLLEGDAPVRACPREGFPRGLNIPGPTGHRKTPPVLRRGLLNMVGLGKGGGDSSDGEMLEMFLAFCLRALSCRGRAAAGGGLGSRSVGRLV